MKKYMADYITAGDKGTEDHGPAVKAMRIFDAHNDLEARAKAEKMCPEGLEFYDLWDKGVNYVRNAIDEPSA